MVVVQRVAPSLADVEMIVAMTDPVLRNLRITQCYHELSAAMESNLAAAANWCTFATWASRQAGSSIRGEDLARDLDRRLVVATPVAKAIEDLVAIEVNRHPLDANALAEGLRTLLRLDAPLARASAAVARGNLKVFEEIGREFARYLAGEEIQGADKLREAFAAYREASSTTDAAKRRELILKANILIGFHEQTRLQPEIREALDTARTELEHVRADITKWLLPGWWRRLRVFVARLLRIKLPLDQAIDRLLDNVYREIREAGTTEMMTLQLPTGTLRLGDGSHDWSDFDYRMRFITDLFRDYQERLELLQAPYSAAQLEVLRLGRLPAPPL